MNLASIVDGHWEGAPALVTDEDVISYGALRSQVVHARGVLTGGGMARGDRVGLVCGTTPLFVVTYLAVLSAGGVAVPLNPSSPPAEMARHLDIAGVGLAIGDSEAMEKLSDVAGNCPSLQSVVNGSERLQAPGVPDVPSVEAVEVATGDAALLVFTAGTAGPSKAATLTHGNLLANLAQLAADERTTLRSDDVTLVEVPLFHIFGLNVVVDMTLYCGARVVLGERFDPAGSLARIRRHGVTVLAGVPPMIAAWSAAAGPRADELASVRQVISGAAPLNPEIARTFAATFGLPVHQGYGLTEAAPVVTTTALCAQVKLGSVGLPLPGIEIRVVDADGAEALAGDPGEIWVRGENVFAGYWADEEATKAVLDPDGWLRTGDIGVRDDDGELFVVDRTKDLIIVSGFNVFPAEVEDVIAGHPAVADVAVVGAPNVLTGEEVRAKVVLRPDAQASAEEIDRFCRERLAGYKCPADIEIVGALARGLAGKILRRTLR
ncbi:MAG: AMP-binding protein [Actinomycetota bacterium]|nr:AMP-binding protein [Actinomycetota bacterium]